ncbi:unnamed protein product [Rotaria sordida]|uniref:F-box domain-containing protein n=1 Tax=Rotaria sordida TaxID=392033 RepID=A0A819KSQ5_9BILA|nr:unnamed protein product [Rotaria sordida]CAF3952120.1 unnamed protein product [Rotaria sordida]
MEQLKRRRTNSLEDSDDIKRKQFYGKIIDTNSLYKESLIHFEDLSNEIFYEIFEYLDFYHVYKAFSNLKKRFENLIIDSKLPIKINISFISKTNFQHYYTDIIIPCLHRVKSLRITILLAVNIILLSRNNISKFIRLETLILDNIEPSYLRNLEWLNILPRLSSLVIISDGYTNDQAEIYHQIFQLPVLRYCKVLLGIHYMPIVSSLPFATNKYSPIEHLVINNNLHLDTLYVILSYVPQLRRLSIPVLFEAVNKQRITFPIALNYLTYISLQLGFITFDDFELLIKNIFYKLQILRLSTSHDITYLDADRWQNLILSHMSNLNVFDLQFIYFVESDEDITFIYDVQINKFTSSFWIERQWFFSTQYSCRQNQYSIMFYSAKPYKRKNFILQEIIKEKINFDAVYHINIENIRAITNYMNYFPNITKLTLDCNLYPICDSIGSSLTRIIPLKQITKLVIDYNTLSIMQLVHLLDFTVNIHTLKLASISLNEIDSSLIQQNVTFQLVSMANIVKNLILEEECSLEKIELLMALCPRLEDLVINGFTFSLPSIIRLLLSKSNNNNRYLSSLCILEMTDGIGDSLKRVIKQEKLLDDFSIKYVYRKLFLWW